MTPQHRAFFAALALTRTSGRPVEVVFARAEYRLYRFSIRIEDSYLFAFDPALKTPIEGRLPLVRYTVGQRVVAFKGESGMFQGFDHSTGEHFRVKVADDVAELFDVSANRSFFFAPEGDPAADALQGYDGASTPDA